MGDPRGDSNDCEKPTVGDMAFKILVVCIGNVCRSAQAERLLQFRLGTLLGPRRGDVSVSSAGVRAMVGYPMDASSARELTRLGGDPDEFVSRQLTAAHVEDADLVLAATKGIRSRVLQEAPRGLKRTFTLTEFAALVDGGTAGSPQELVAEAAARRASAEVANYDIEDPIGASADVHRCVAETVDHTTRVIGTAIADAARRARVNDTS